MWLEGEVGELGDSYVISLWIMGFAVPVGRLSDVDIQWEEPKSEVSGKVHV